MLGPHEAAGTTASGMVVGPGTGDNMGAALGLGLGPGDIVVSLGTSGTVFGVARGTDGGPDRVRRRVRRRDRPLPPAGLHPQRGPGPHLRRDHARHRPRRPRRAGPLGAARGRWAHPAALPRRRAHPRPARRDRHPRRPHPGEPHAGERRPRRRRGHAVRPGRRARRVARQRRPRPSGAAHRRCGAVHGGAGGGQWRSSASPVSVPSPGEYVALGAARQAAWVLARSRGHGAEEPPGWAIGAQEVPDPAATGPPRCAARTPVSAGRCTASDRTGSAHPIGRVGHHAAWAWASPARLRGWTAVTNYEHQPVEEEDA